jgi:DNA modification methylase
MNLQHKTPIELSTSESLTKVSVLIGDVLTQLKHLADQSVQTCITSPPYYGLRDYGVSGQIGLEATPYAYVEQLVAVFREVRRVLRNDGVVFLNLDDTYASTGDKGVYHDPKYPVVAPKNLLGIPWRVALALQEDGWILRSDIIWAKGNPIPESVKDRPTRSHEYIFLLSKSPHYYYDAQAIAERAVAGDNGSYFDRGKTGAVHANQGKDRRDKQRLVGKRTYVGFNDRWNASTKSLMRNRRDVWFINTQPYPEAHFAVWPEKLVELMVLAGCPPAGKRCDCAEVINTPIGKGPIDDPTRVTGRAGFNRPRRDGEGSRPVTRREQRWEADLMRHSPHKDAMRNICGDAFDHYIRIDRSGARPLPPAIREDFFVRGWLTEAPPCDHPIEDAGTVLDPFAGSGTTLAVANRLGRHAVGIELNPNYIPLIQRRLQQEYFVL